MNSLSLFASFAVAVLIAASFAVATSPAPVKASGASGAKGDRLPIQKFRPACSGQAWPYYETECVRDHRQPAGQPLKVRQISIAAL